MPSFNTMSFDARFADALARLPDYLGNHVLVSITALALGLGVSLPIATEVHAVLFEGKSPREAVLDLMRREPVAEMEGLEGR